MHHRNTICYKAKKLKFPHLRRILFFRFPIRQNKQTNNAFLRIGIKYQVHKQAKRQQKYCVIGPGSSWAKTKVTERLDSGFYVSRSAFVCGRRIGFSIKYGNRTSVASSSFPTKSVNRWSGRGLWSAAVTTAVADPKREGRRGPRERRAQIPNQRGW